MNDKKKANGIGWLFFAIIALYLLMYVGVNLLAQKDIELPTVLAIVSGEITIILPICIYMVVNKISIKDDMGYRPIKIGTIIVSIFMGLVAMPIASLVNVLTQFFVSNTMVQSTDALFGAGSTGAALIVASIIGPICEEFAFRGLFFESMKKVSTPLKAVLVSAICFGLMHLNFNQCCYAIVLGIIFAIANIASGSTYTSTIMHVVINGFNMVALLVASKAQSAQGQDIAQAAEELRSNTGVMIAVAGVYGVLAAICITIIVLLIVLTATIENRRDKLKEMITKPFASTEGKILINIPMIITIVICIVLMIGFESFLK